MFKKFLKLPLFNKYNSFLTDIKAVTALEYGLIAGATFFTVAVGVEHYGPVIRDAIVGSEDTTNKDITFNNSSSTVDFTSPPPTYVLPPPYNPTSPPVVTPDPFVPTKVSTPPYTIIEDGGVEVPSSVNPGDGYDCQLKPGSSTSYECTKLPPPPTFYVYNCEESVAKSSGCSGYDSTSAASSSTHICKTVHQDGTYKHTECYQNPPEPDPEPDPDPTPTSPPPTTPPPPATYTWSGYMLCPCKDYPCRCRTQPWDVDEDNTPGGGYQCKVVAGGNLCEIIANVNNNMETTACGASSGIPDSDWDYVCTSSSCSPCN